MVKPQIKRILTMRRLPNSVNGNPRWQVWFTDGDVRLTKSDANVGHQISNSTYKNKDVKVTLTRHGRIETIEVAE